VRPKWPGVESETVTGGKRATLTEASLLLAVFFLGTNPVAVKLAVADVPPLPFVAMRFVLAGLVVFGLVLLLGPGNRPGRRDLLSMAGVGLIGVGMNNGAFTLGVSMTTASDTALIYAAVPIWGILLGLALGLERPTRWGVAGVGLAFLGVGVVVYGGSREEAARASSGTFWSWSLRCAGDLTLCSRCRCSVPTRHSWSPPTP
jgi:drug/metabolite transporter (DMT)-like permease